MRAVICQINLSASDKYTKSHQTFLPFSALTKEAIPEKQGAPRSTALSQTSLLVQWNPPEYANGIIIYYELWMRGIAIGKMKTFSRGFSQIRLHHNIRTILLKQCS